MYVIFNLLEIYGKEIKLNNFVEKYILDNFNLQYLEIMMLVFFFYFVVDYVLKNI